jgi:hypothetical protein
MFKIEENQARNQCKASSKQSLKIQAIYFSETYIDFQQITCQYIPSIPFPNNITKKDTCTESVTLCINFIPAYQWEM